MEIVLRSELGNTNVLRCPSDRVGLYETTASSYSWNSLLNGQRADDLTALGMKFDAHAMPVFFDKESFHAARGANKAVNYLYADGHIKTCSRSKGQLKVMIELPSAQKVWATHGSGDLTLSVPRGEVFGLLGHNGAGRARRSTVRCWGRSGRRAVK